MDTSVKEGSFLQGESFGRNEPFEERKNIGSSVSSLFGLHGRNPCSQQCFCRGKDDIQLFFITLG